MQIYETRFAEQFGADYFACAFWKARVALYAILRSLRIKEGEEIILPGYTCVVVPNAIRFAGGTPVYADINPQTYGLEPARVLEKITPRTRALLVQHTYGLPGNLGILQGIAKKHSLALIEDCAHVLVGSAHGEELLGSFGDAAFFSSQWSKPYTTGLGGMVVTRDAQLAEAILKIQSDFCEPPFTTTLRLRIQYYLFKRIFKPQLYWLSQNCLRALSKFGFSWAHLITLSLTASYPRTLDGKCPHFNTRPACMNLFALERMGPTGTI